MWYLRGESKFSDHRPVYSLFAVQIDLTNKKKPKPAVPTSTTSNNRVGPNSRLPVTCVAKVQAEELLLLTRAKSCLDAGSSRFWVTQAKLTFWRPMQNLQLTVMGLWDREDWQNSSWVSDTCPWHFSTVWDGGWWYIDIYTFTEEWIKKA